jgi:hypothetical protein
LLTEGACLPEKAGLIGIITFEDVLETLLQEEIYDEMDLQHRAGHRLADLVCRRWRAYTAQKRKTMSNNNQSTVDNEDGSNENIPASNDVAPKRRSFYGSLFENKISNESTALLGSK